jgi:hypothetical protein
MLVEKNHVGQSLSLGRGNKFRENEISTVQPDARRE